MDKRQQKILRAIIREYNETVQPVGSRILYEKYSLNISPATIRWEMVELTDDNYLEQPHISAGRIPSDKAYRFFVEELTDTNNLTEKEEKTIYRSLIKIKENEKQNNSILNKQIAEVLADVSHNLSLINRNRETIYEAGLNWLVREPEFYEREKLVDLVDSFRDLDNIFNDDIFNSVDDDSRVFVGEEFLGSKLRDCSLIVKRLKTQRDDNAAIGILGTRRMNYAKNISLLDYTSKILTNLFN